MFLASLALASLSLGSPDPSSNSLEILVPSICQLHYGNKTPRSSDWIRIGEETDEDGTITPIYTVCRPA